MFRTGSKFEEKVKETYPQEINLDDIALNTSNSNKVQISVTSNLNYHQKVWQLQKA